MSWEAIVLHRDDNVATALRALQPGEAVTARTPFEPQTIVPREAIPLCHKVALSDIAAGEPVRKYGQIIGEARTAIRRGDLVHVHNLVSRRARVDHDA